MSLEYGHFDARHYNRPEYEIGIEAFDGRHFLPEHFETVIVIPEYAITIRIKYIKGYAQIKRNGKIIAYRTPYTPFRPPRKVPVEKAS